MAQYDVFANPSSSAADGIPYVVVIQSDLTLPPKNVVLG
jgi:toxin CcdB